MSHRFDYDPELALWKPGRRSFLFLFGASVVAPFLPDVTGIAPGPLPKNLSYFYPPGFLEKYRVESLRSVSKPMLLYSLDQRLS